MLRQTALAELGGIDDAIRQWAREHGVREQPLPLHATCACERELREAASRPGITLASHSWSHPNLSRLTGSELEDEIRRPLEWLRERFPGVIPWLAYPYGRVSQEAEEATAAAGYDGALRGGGGLWPQKPQDMFSLPRVNVPAGVSLNRFALRAAGLFSG